MGLLTRVLRRSTLRVMSIAFCTPELMPAKSERFTYNQSSRATIRTYDSAQRGTLASVAEEEEEPNEDDDLDNPRALYVIRGVQWASVVFDVLDLINAVLDLVFAVRLAKLPDATVYAVIVILGLVLGRIVLFKATWVLFHGGIQMNQSLQDLLPEKSPFRGKNIVALQLLYCLAYAETAAFLFENYPSLATYAFWRVINSTPSPLERIDEINVIMTVVLCVTLAFILLTTTLTVTAWQWYLRLRYAADTWQDKVYQGGILVLGGVFVSAVITFMWQIISLAWRVTIQDERVFPSGDLLWGWISICEDVESMADRLSFCDERAFLIKTALAWTLASYFAYFLFFQPAKLETTTATTTTAGQTASGKAASQGAASQRDDTSTSHSGTDRMDGGEVDSELGRTVTVMPTPLHRPPKAAQPHTPQEVRPKPRNRSSALQPVTQPTTPTRAPSKPFMRKPDHHDRQAHRRVQDSEPRHAIDPYGLGNASPRPHAVGPVFDKKARPSTGFPKPLVPRSSEPKPAPPPPDPFSSMARFEAVLAAAETVEQKMKRSSKQVTAGSSKSASTPPPNPLSSIDV